MIEQGNPFAAETAADPARLPEMERRRIATQATIDAFRGKVFSWTGRKTCLHLLHAHLKACGVKVPRLPNITGPLGARKALARRGVADMAGLLDQFLPRLDAPAMMTTGDVGVMASADGIGGVLICVAPDAVLGWMELVCATEDDEGVPLDTCEVLLMQPGQIEAAWRVPVADSAA